jgi:hypothetical protein
MPVEVLWLHRPVRKGQQQPPWMDSGRIMAEAAPASGARTCAVIVGVAFANLQDDSRAILPSCKWDHAVTYGVVPSTLPPG